MRQADTFLARLHPLSLSRCPSVSLSAVDVMGVFSCLLPCIFVDPEKHEERPSHNRAATTGQDTAAAAVISQGNAAGTRRGEGSASVVTTNLDDGREDGKTDRRSYYVPIIKGAIGVLEPVSELSDAFPPLKIVAAGLKLIVEHAEVSWSFLHDFGQELKRRVRLRKTTKSLRGTFRYVSSSFCTRWQLHRTTQQ